MRTLQQHMLLALARLLLPSPVAEAATLVLDGGDWHLSGDRATPGGKAVAVERATVPGGVWDNLQRAGLVGNPLYRDNDLVFANITTQGPIKGWTFFKQFDCPPDIMMLAAASGGGAAVLEFEGLQTLANVTLNGKLVIEADNMFRPHRALLPPGLLRPRGNQLSVHLVTHSSTEHKLYVRRSGLAWPRCCATRPTN